MKHSIRNRIAVAIVALLLFVLGTSFLMNNVFLEKYYMVQKERSLIKVYTLINSYDLPNSYQEDDFQSNLELLCNRYNIRLVISGEEIESRARCVSSDQDKSLLAGRLFAYHYGVSSYDKDVLIKTDNYTVQKIRDPFNEQECLEIWGGLDNNYNFIMRLALDSIWDSVKISNEFFTYFAIAGVVFGIILAVWLSKQITKPIQELTDLSKRMADLDFEAKYTAAEMMRLPSWEIILTGCPINFRRRSRSSRRQTMNYRVTLRKKNRSMRCEKSSSPTFPMS